MGFMSLYRVCRVFIVLNRARLCPENTPRMRFIHQECVRIHCVTSIPCGHSRYRMTNMVSDGIEFLIQNTECNSQ